MRSMQCNVEFGYQLSIRSGTKENQGKPRNSNSSPNWRGQTGPLGEPQSGEAACGPRPHPTSRGRIADHSATSVEFTSAGLGRRQAQNLRPFPVLPYPSAGCVESRELSSRR
jgi:hypothetical protein